MPHYVQNLQTEQYMGCVLHRSSHRSHLILLEATHPTSTITKVSTLQGMRSIIYENELQNANLISDRQNRPDAF